MFNRNSSIINVLWSDTYIIYFLSIPSTFCKVQVNRADSVTYTVLLSKIMKILQGKKIENAGIWLIYDTLCFTQIALN